eukprot:UC4_evm4s1043
MSSSKSSSFSSIHSKGVHNDTFGIEQKGVETLIPQFHEKTWNVRWSKIHSSLEKYGYSTKETIGSGAYAKVKRARSRIHNIDVAIKIISLKKAPESFIKKFLPRELEAIRSLKHKNIVEFLEVVTSKDKIFIVMELAKGGDLLDFINKKKCNSAEICKFLFRQLVSAVACCHSKNIAHRDLKCENILLDGRGNIKLADFGFATKLDSGKLHTHCGSYAYAAPEILKGEAYDGRASDIWSMGVILYAMIFTRLPFDDDSVSLLLLQIKKKLKLPKAVESNCKSLLHLLLSENPKKRINMESLMKHPWIYKGSFLSQKTKRSSLTELSNRTERAPIKGNTTSGAGAGAGAVADISLTAKVIGLTNINTDTISNKTIVSEHTTKRDITNKRLPPLRGYKNCNDKITYSRR